MTETQMLRISVDAIEQLRALAALEGCSMGKLAEKLIEQAHAAKFSQPNADVTVEDALAAAGAVN